MDERLWLRIQNALNKFATQYNLLTKILSFGRANKFRLKLAKKIKATDSVVEIGCGPGTLANEINFKEYVGVDPLKIMILIARNMVKKQNTSFIRGYAEKLPFKNNRFDVAICSFSFRDFLDKDKALCEISRILKPKGKLLILDIPDGCTGNKIAISLFYLISGLLLTITLLDKRYLMLRDFVFSIWKMPKLDEIAKKLVKCGFRKVRIERYLLNMVFILEVEK